MMPSPASLASAEPGTGTMGETPSGAALIRSGLAAFAARVHAARSATERLDLQYYNWRDDLTGRLLAHEVLEAARRGVHVRMLLDDMYAIGRERLLAALAAHPRIEVRLFNAISWRRFGLFGLPLEMLFGGWHLNRRMHNKAWIADGRLAICGGRNVGDEYFDAPGEWNFRDLDLVLDGSAAGEAQVIFERYWSHRLSRPVSELAVAPESRRGGFRRLSLRLAAAAAEPGADRFLHALGTDPDVAEIRAGDRKRLTFLADREIEVVADPPDKACGRAEEKDCLSPLILAMLERAQREALLISPYFVPGATGAAMLEGLARRGVRVSVVTNSLAATDVVAVHGGYMRYRERLLAAGVRFHELCASGPAGASLLGSRGAKLHTKALVVDGESAFVGSFNLDPRSVALNTEMGVFLRHRGLAAGIRDEHERLTSGGRSWRVECHPDGGLRWTMRGQELRTEPNASVPRRALSRLARWLPIEAHL